MSKARKAEWDHRDLLFVHSCEKCARAWRCSFKSSLEGPEAVCQRLISEGGYNCESCIRRNINGGCTFICVFFREKVPLEPEHRGVLAAKAPEYTFSERLAYLSTTVSRKGADGCC